MVISYPETHGLVPLEHPASGPASAGVAERVRIAMLGHTSAVNRKNYTDTTDTSSMPQSLEQLRQHDQVFEPSYQAPPVCGA